MEFWSSRGTVGSPVLLSCEQSTFSSYHSVSPISVFLILSFFQLWSFESFLVDHLLWDVLRYALLGIPVSLAVSTFSFSFPSGWNPVLSIWKPLVIILFFVLPCSGSPRFSSVCCYERSLGSTGAFAFCFLFSSSVFFLRAVPVFLYLCAWRIRASWWLLRILTFYPLPWLSLLFF